MPAQYPFCGTGTVDGVPYPSINYTTYATGDPKNTFFKNDTANDGTAATTTDIFGITETGIVDPWVKVVDPTAEQLTEEQLNALKADFPIYTITNVATGAYKTEELKKDSNNQSIPFKIQDANDLTTWAPVDGAYVSVNNHVVDSQGRVIETDEDGNLKTDANGFVLVKETKPVCKAVVSSR